MKYVKLTSLTIILFLTILCMPIVVEAKEKINVYLFWGEGCPHCETAKEYFNELKKDYSKYFELHSFEVWNNEKNNTLFKNVANELNKNVQGIPFILVGDKTFSGFNDAIGKNIKNVIIEQYNSGTSNDIVSKYIEEKEVPIKRDSQNKYIPIIIFSGLALFVGILSALKRRKK